jgi:hypothetical protein
MQQSIFTYVRTASAVFADAWLLSYKGFNGLGSMKGASASSIVLGIPSRLVYLVGEFTSL